MTDFSHVVQQSGTDNGFAPPPVRNASQVGVGVFSHSGELVVTASDLRLPGRGDVAPAFERRYRSSVTDDRGDFGRAFTWTYSRRLTEGDDGVVYRNGYAEQYIFEPVDTGEYTNDLLYAVLVSADDQRSEWELRSPGGRIERFESPDEGGRLLAIEDRNENAIEFKYTDETVTVTGPRERETEVVYDEGHIVSIEDYDGRTVTYEYDSADRLQTVELANDGTKQYDWTDSNRISSVTGPGTKKPFLENDYDDEGRVVRQRHGTGELTITYEQVDTHESGFPIYRTHVAQKGVSEGNLHLEHNAAGQVTRRVFDEPVETERTDDDATIRTMEDRDLSSAEIEEGVAHIETTTRYNERGEWIHREFPEGGKVERTFDADANDPRDRGNLLEHRHIPNPNRPTDHDERVITATYGRFQRRKKLTDARGNATEFEYDDRGNLVEKTHPEVEIPDLRDPGTSRTERYTEEWTYNQFGQPVEYRDQENNRTRYEYYPAEGPYALGKATFGSEKGGPLGRVSTERGLTMPPHVLGSQAFEATTDWYEEAYEYDELERVTTFRDGKGNDATHKYDAHGNPVKTVDRAGIRTEREFDLADNLVTEEKSFTRYVDDDTEGTVGERETSLQEYREYNLLNNVVAFGQIAVADREDGTEIARRETSLDRDQNENVLRRTYPDGVTDVYTYSRRGKRVETRAAAGTDSEGTHRFRFQRDGQERARTDAGNYRLTKEYDGFSRLLSVTNPDGVTKRRVYDPANNLRASYLFTPGEDTPGSRGADTVSDGGQVAMVAQFNNYDSMNRCSGGRTVSAGCQALDPRVGGHPTGGLGNHRSSGCGGDSGPDGDIPGVTPEKPPGSDGPGDPDVYSGRASGFSGNEGETNVVFERDGTGANRRVFNENGNGEVTTFARDGGGNVVAIADEAGNSTFVNRNGNGQATTVQSQGQSVTSEDGDSLPDGGSIIEPIAVDGVLDDPREGDDPPRFVRTEIVRDEKDRVIAAFRNDKFLGAVDYDAFDRVTQIEDIEGDRVRVLSDEFGRQTGGAAYSKEDERWLNTSLELDPMGRVMSATDPEGRTVEFERDASGRLVERTNPDGTTVSRTYNENGQVTALSDPKGIDLEQDFDETNRLRERTVESANGVRTERYNYDNKGRLTSAVDEVTGVEVTRGFDEHDYLQWETQTVGGESRTVVYDRTADGQVSELTYPDASSVEYEYDGDGDLTRVTHGDGTEVARFTLDSSRVHDATFGDDVVRAEYEYDNRACSNGCLVGKRFENVDGDVVGGFRVRKNNDGTIGAVEEPFYSREDTTFGIDIDRDSLKRPIELTTGTDLDAEEERPFDTHIDYSFDESGRIAAKSIDGPSGALTDQKASFDANGNYQSLGELSFELDENGNRASETGDLAVPDLRSTWDLDASRDLDPVPLPQIPECYQTCDHTEYIYAYDNTALGIRCFDEDGDLLRVVHFIYGPLDRVCGEIVTCCTDEEPDRFHRYVHAGNQLVQEEIYEGDFDPLPDHDGGMCDVDPGDESRGIPQPPRSLPDDPIEIKQNVYAGRLVEIDVEREDEHERLFVTHDAAGRNATVVDEGGEVREAVRYDGVGKAYQTMAEGEAVETVDQFAPGVGVLNTLDAAGQDIFDRVTGERMSGGDILDQYTGGKTNGGGPGGSGSDKNGGSSGKGGGSKCGKDIVGGQGKAMDVSGAEILESAQTFFTGTGVIGGGMAATPEPVSTAVGTGMVIGSGAAIIIIEGGEIVLKATQDEDPASGDGGSGGGSGGGGGDGGDGGGGGGGGGGCESGSPAMSGSGAMESKDGGGKGGGDSGGGSSGGNDGGDDGKDGGGGSGDGDDGKDGGEGGGDGDDGGEGGGDGDDGDDDGEGEGGDDGGDGGGDCGGGSGAASCQSPTRCGGNPTGGTGGSGNGGFNEWGGGTDDGIPDGPDRGFGLGGRCGNSYPAGRGRGNSGPRGGGRGGGSGGCNGGGQNGGGEPGGAEPGGAEPGGAESGGSAVRRGPAHTTGNDGCGFGRGGPVERMGSPGINPGGNFPGSNGGGGCGSGGSNGLSSDFGDQTCRRVIPKRGSNCGGVSDGAAGSDTSSGGASCGCGVVQRESTKMTSQRGLSGSPGSIDRCAGGGDTGGVGGGSGGSSCGDGTGGPGGINPHPEMF